MFKELAKKLYKEKYLNNEIFLNPNSIEEFALKFMNLLFPQRNPCKAKCVEELEKQISDFNQSLIAILKQLKQSESDCNRISKTILERLPLVDELLMADANAMYKGDPAAETVDEVILCYPGFYAIAIYRLAHEFYKLQVKIFPRLLSEYAHERTGIDIHPGATVGKNFFIDHGTGIVIGETTTIGENVKIYQGVTLGALSVDKSMEHKKRHPTIEDNCVIYSNATILGGETIIGKNSVIGGNVWITKSIKENSMVYHKSEIKMLSNKGLSEE